MPTKFLGPDFQINSFDLSNGGILGNQDWPQVTALGDGRFAVVYQSSVVGSGTFTDIVEAFFNVDGSASTPVVQTVYVIGEFETQPVAAALAGGGYGVAFTNQLHADGSMDANPGNITYERVGPTGANGTPLAIADFNSTGHANLFNPAIATLSTGRQVVAFENTFAAGNDDIYLNVVSADGLSTQFAAASAAPVANNSSWEANPAVAAIGNTAMVVFEDGFGTTIDSANITARIFDGGTNTVGPRIPIADHTRELTGPKITALDDHRYVITYVDAGATYEMFGRIYDTSGKDSLSAEFQIDQPAGPGAHNFLPSVATTADGGFVVTWTRFLGGDYDVLGRRFNSDGVAMGQQFIVNHLTDDDQTDSSVAVSGANAFFAWTDDAPRPGDSSGSSVRGQVMSLTTPPDFNDNGVSDILWRNGSGGLVAWDMNRSGAIGGSGFVTYGGAVIAPDAFYSIAAISDFSGDGRADVLWRNTSGSLIEWLMNGSVITQSSYVTSGGTPVNPDPSWSFLGAGDFNGDGVSDMLWRSASGEIVEWQMNGTVIAGSGDLNAGGGAVFLGAAWSVAGIGDFNGDGKSDIIWRNASGEVAQWQMNGSTIIGSGDLNAGGVAVAPGANWSVAGVGDFNADGNADLLWRDGSSGALVEWLMNGSSIIGSGPLMSGSTPVNPDPSWHVVEIGDFNGDARADILWRNDSGAMAEWFMKSTAIVGTATPSSGGAAITPDASWTVQAKPTDFA